MSLQRHEMANAKRDRHFTAFSVISAHQGKWLVYFIPMKYDFSLTFTIWLGIHYYQSSVPKWSYLLILLI